MRARLSLVVAGLLGLAGLVVMAAPAQAAVTVNITPGVVVVSSDGAGDTITVTCTTNIFVNGEDTTAPCSGRAVDVQGGPGDDVIDVSALATTSVDGVTVDGGDGNDRVFAHGFTSGTTDQVVVTGGAGDDTMIGTDINSLKGGPGNDTLSDFGYVGNLIDGEAGNDTFTFDFTPAGQVALDLTPLNSGLLIEIAGGAGQFFPWSSIEAVDLVMNAGNNAVNAFAFDGTTKVIGNGGNDTLTGGDSADHLHGGPGDDTIEGGAGADTVSAGDGSDLLRMADGVADSVDCGTGGDIAVADPADALAGCETVDVPPQPAVPDTTKPTPIVSAAKLKGKQVRVPVRCPATEVRCVGEVTLKVVGKRHGNVQKISIGRALLVADGGDKETIKLSISSAKAQAIRALTKPKLKVGYDLVDVAGNKAKGTVTVKLKVL